VPRRRWLWPSSGNAASRCVMWDGMHMHMQEDCVAELRLRALPACRRKTRASAIRARHARARGVSMNWRPLSLAYGPITSSCRRCAGSRTAHPSNLTAGTPSASSSRCCSSARPCPAPHPLDSRATSPVLSRSGGAVTTTPT